ncbi:MAG: sigma 54-interacting transcriptional regulator [Candidatus Acidiferrum sp.]|jgi:DNA-binding NtrC family response regulator
MSSQTNSVLDIPAEATFVFGQGTAMRAINAMVADVAPTDISVLLIGESGTGKEAYARLIHRLSEGRATLGQAENAGSRQAGETPLRKISCATHDAPRFLAQLRDCLALEAASENPGCLFLDGIEELDLGCQRTLASMLPDGEPEAGRARKTRLISSTSVDLEKAIETGRFRRELYFRINGASLRLPPLRERKEDIPGLVEHFLAKHSRGAKAAPVLNSEALELLVAHAWPGNIRELENIVKKMVAFADSKVALSELRAAPQWMRQPEAAPEPRISSLKVAARAASRRTERELILKALERTHWNRKRAAQELQISYKSLLYKIKQIDVPGPGSEEL